MTLTPILSAAPITSYSLDGKTILPCKPGDVTIKINGNGATTYFHNKLNKYVQVDGIYFILSNGIKYHIANGFAVPSLSA